MVVRKLFKINGVTMPSPAELSVGIQDISKAERNARGTMIMERITTKRKIDLAWKHLNNSELQILLNAASNIFFEVDYPDPQANGQRFGTFYAGDRTIGAMIYRDGIMVWQDIKFSIIER